MPETSLDGTLGRRIGCLGALSDVFSVLRRTGRRGLCEEVSDGVLLEGSVGDSLPTLGMITVMPIIVDRLWAKFGVRSGDGSKI